jgi:hypothetical protein
VQTSGGDIGNGRRETKVKQTAERKDMIGNATSIGMMSFDREIGAVEEQVIKDIRRIVRPGALASDWTLRPRVGLSYLRMTRDATDETGGSAFALSV